MQISIRTKHLDDGASACEVAPALKHPLRDIDGLAQTFSYDLEQQICSEARGGEHWYRLVSGAARRIVLRPDGRRQTIDILAPGDYFGFFIPDDKGLIVEAAAEDTSVALYPRWCVDFLAEVDSATGQALRDLELDAISRARVHLFFGRRMTAAAKVGSFLLDMANRLDHDARGWFELPVSLDAVAEFLELSPGTLNCCLMLFAGRGAIARARGGRLRILDRNALRDNEIVLTPAERPSWPLMAQRSGYARRRPDRRPTLEELNIGEVERWG